MGQVPDHIISEVIETKLIVGAISYICLISLAAGDSAKEFPLLIFRLIAGVINIGWGSLASRLLGIDAGHAYPQSAVNGTHPVAIPLGQIIIDGNQMAALSCEGIEVERQGSYQGFALASFHLGYLPLVKDDSPY